MFLLDLAEWVLEDLNDDLKGFCLDEVDLLVEFLNTRLADNWRVRLIIDRQSKHL